MIALVEALYWAADDAVGKHCGAERAGSARRKGSAGWLRELLRVADTHQGRKGMCVGGMAPGNDLKH
ncbi:hypothetical protein AADZ90_009145 [Aestuariibius sp. 2305UL40-4]|uniref:hypothetical protein n=1 Tax=Aestuariibius violaceus TaxID=3234132 RepID=UPI0034965F3E